MFAEKAMRCVVCGQKRRSDAETDRAWRVVVSDGVRFYECPDELGGDGASGEDFERAYVELVPGLWGRSGRRQRRRRPRWWRRLRRRRGRGRRRCYSLIG